MPVPNAVRRLQAALDRLTPQMRRAVQAAMAKLSRRLSLDQLVALAEGRGELALRGAIAGLDRDLREAAQVMTQAFALGGASAGAGVGLQFNASRPLAARAAEETGAALVRGVSDETRKAIRTIVARAQADGLSPRDVAKAIKPLIGLTERQALAVLKFRAELVKKGVLAPAIEKKVAAYTASLLKSRAELIARTELLKAANQGRLAAWRQAQQDGKLGADSLKTWIVTPDDKLCPVCAPMDGVQVPIDGAFLVNGSSLDGPPAHPRCRCAMGLTAARARGRRAA